MRHEFYFVKNALINTPGAIEDILLRLSFDEFVTMCDLICHELIYLENKRERESHKNILNSIRVKLMETKINIEIKKEGEKVEV